MARSFSLIALVPAMIVVTPATAQAVPTPADNSAAAPAANSAAEVSFADAPQPHSVRIAGKTVAIDTLPSSGDADQKAPPKSGAKAKVRGRR